ncbi:hypothetical protein LSAT2_005127 [Lamellibrachia satsuma]|nr:hypothetical protein LSAT2_005127 [Lamellibrachia satsuma]
MNNKQASNVMGVRGCETPWFTYGLLTSPMVEYNDEFVFLRTGSALDREDEVNRLWMTPSGLVTPSIEGTYVMEYLFKCASSTLAFQLLTHKDARPLERTGTCKTLESLYRCKQCP